MTQPDLFMLPGFANLPRDMQGLCLSFGWILGTLRKPELRAELVASLRLPDGLNPGYLMVLRDECEAVLRDSGHGNENAP